MFAIVDSPNGEQGSKTIPHSINQRSRAPNIQIGFLLTGKGRIGKVLGSRSRPHGNICFILIIVTG